MSELTYKKIIDVEQIETLNDAATVFVNDNGAIKQVGADKFSVVKSIDGITPDETGNIAYKRSNPIPFNKAGNTIKCTIPFAEAIAIASSGTNQANVTLALSTFDVNTSLLIAETKYASSVTVGIKSGAGEKLWLQADFDMDDGSVIRLRLNPDESVTETIIKPESDTIKTINGIEPDENGDVFTEDLADICIVDMTDVVPGRISMNYRNKPYAEIIDMLARGGSNVRGAIVSRICLLSTGAQPVYTATAYDPFALHKMRIHFGDNICPIIIDAEANTITLDSDWVAPEADPEPTDAHQMLVTDVEGKQLWEERTHWEDSTLDVVLPEVTIDKKTAYLNDYVLYTRNLQQGHTYHVVCDGAEYQCSPVWNDALYSYTIGNASLASLGSDTGEPFFINAHNNMQMTIIYFSSEGQHTIAIDEGVINTIHTLDPKYIPSTIARKSDLEGLGEPCKYVFLNSPLGFMAPYSVDELFAYASDSSAYNKNSFIHRIQNPMNPSEPVRDYHCTNIDITVSKMILYFGDLVAPIIIDKDADTITLDPDWVAPQTPLTEEDVNALIDSKLGVIENGAY